MSDVETQSLNSGTQLNDVQLVKVTQILTRVS